MVSSCTFLESFPGKTFKTLTHPASHFIDRQPDDLPLLWHKNDPEAGKTDAK
jgi:hypothetical protein